MAQKKEEKRSEMLRIRCTGKTIIRFNTFQATRGHKFMEDALKALLDMADKTEVRYP